MNIDNLIRSSLLNFKTYSSAAVEAHSGSVWLNANEMPENNAVADDTLALNRYPKQPPLQLIACLADYFQVTTEQLLVTRGSNEGIDLLIRLCCEARQDAIMVCPPTYGMYQFFAQLQDVPVFSVPLVGDNFACDFQGLRSQWEPRVKLIFLCSPNNPTGSLLSIQAIQALCDALQDKAIVVVDEAYIEFSQSTSAITLIDTVNNLVVLRTLSKALGLAALRLGVLITNAALIAWLTKILCPYSLSPLPVRAALSSLKPPSTNKIKSNINDIIEQREWLYSELQSLSITQAIWRSFANFILVQFDRPVLSACLSHGIVLRDMQGRVDRANTVRITVGAPDENQQLLKVLRSL